MEALFLELVKMSMTGTLFALAVFFLRLIFRKAPKWLFCLLWGVVALRLIVPLSVESSFSLIPNHLASGQIVAEFADGYIGNVDYIYEDSAAYDAAIDAGREPIYSNNGYYVITAKDSLEAPATVANTVIPALSWIWFAGMLLMTLHTLLSFAALKCRVATATIYRDNIRQSEQVDSPFVLGFFHPIIYLPYQLNESDMDNVIAHEQAHIRRSDHWWKPIGYLILSFHWLNPVMWIAYVLLCRDIEAACDEKVIKHMEKDEMRAYSTALLNCSVHRRRIAACPLAFGEVGVKKRIKSVMNYKKPAFWIIVAAMIACAVIAACFLTNPKTPSPHVLPHIHSHTYGVVEITYESGSYSFSMVAQENTPIYAIVEDMQLSSQKEHSQEGVWTQLGKLEETELTKENFDELFKDPGNWADNTNAKSIRNNTENAWQLIYNQDVLYYVLQQKNGDLYLAYGYTGFSNNDAHYAHIRWLYKLAIDTTGLSGMIAKSGNGAVSMVSFPKGTMIQDYVDSVYWLTINPSDEELVPFSTWRDGEEIRGFYTAYDAVTFEPLKHIIPSGLDPQTYLFQNADPSRAYIVLAAFSMDENAEIYAFGANFAQPSGYIQEIPVRDLASKVDRIILHNLYTQNITEITEKAAVDSVIDYLGNIVGEDLGSTKGWYGGCYAIKLMREENEVFHVVFAEDTRDWFYYGYVEGDNYPARFGLQNVTVADVMAFLGQYDTGNTG